MALSKRVPPRPPTKKPPPPAPTVERRGSERFELLAHVELRRHEEVYLLPIANISGSGMLVRVDDGSLTDIAVQERVSVYLDLEDMPEPIALTLDATVVRLVRAGERLTGFAVVWSSATPATRAQIEKVLQYARARGAV